MKEREELEEALNRAEAAEGMVKVLRAEIDLRVHDAEAAEKQAAMWEQLRVEAEARFEAAEVERDKLRKEQRFLVGREQCIVNARDVQCSGRRSAEAERDKLVERVRVLEEALDGLLDGLDANHDERCGLSTEQWNRRVAAARAALEEEKR